MTSITALENRVDELEGDTGGGGGTEIVITSTHVDRDGNDVEAIEQLRHWNDGGTWRTETTDLRDREDV